MTEPRRLNLDLSPLWLNPREDFIIRYLDISPANQKLLAKRIKLTSTIFSIKTRSGPSIEKIEETLKEINPIIFSENLSYGYNYNNHARFGRNNIHIIAGYYYNELCRAIYWMCCRKKPLNENQLETIAMLTCANYSLSREFVHENNQSVVSPEEQTRLSCEPVSLQEIEHARINAENNGATRDPVPRERQTYSSISATSDFGETITASYVMPTLTTETQEYTFFDTNNDDEEEQNEDENNN